MARTKVSGTKRLYQKSSTSSSKRTGAPRVGGVVTQKKRPGRPSSGPSKRELISRAQAHNSTCCIRNYSKMSKAQLASVLNSKKSVASGAPIRTMSASNQSNAEKRVNAVTDRIAKRYGKSSTPSSEPSEAAFARNQARGFRTQHTYDPKKKGQSLQKLTRGMQNHVHHQRKRLLKNQIQIRIQRSELVQLL